MRPSGKIGLGVPPNEKSNPLRLKINFIAFFPTYIPGFSVFKNRGEKVHLSNVSRKESLKEEYHIFSQDQTVLGDLFRLCRFSGKVVKR